MRNCVFWVSVLMGVAVLSGAGASAQVLEEDSRLEAELSDFDKEAVEYRRWLGWSSATHAGKGLFGAIQDFGNGVYNGAAYLFDLRTGEQLMRIVPTVDTAARGFGSAVAFNDEYVVVGARAGLPKNGTYSGAAFVFDAKTGDQLYRVIPDDVDAWYQFGESVAIVGRRLLVGAAGNDDRGDSAGAVYVYDIASGAFERKLLTNDGVEGDQFGRHFAASDAYVVAGAATDDDAGQWSGSAYVFDIETGQQLHKLVAEDAEPRMFFGGAVAIEGDMAVIGAPDFDDGPGFAYVFDLISGEQLYKLRSPREVRGGRFGYTVSLSAGVIFVGEESGDGVAFRTGVAHAFDARSREFLATFRASDGARADSFGESLAVADSWLVVGAPFNSVPVYRVGAAYAYDLRGLRCLVDWDGNGIVNAADVGAFLSTYFLDQLNGTTDADFNGDGVTNAADVGAFLSAYFPAQGACP